MAKRSIIGIIVFIIMTVILFSVSMILIKSRLKKSQDYIDAITVEYSGNIIQKQKVKRSGRNIVICCVDVDYSNVDSITIHNKSYWIYLRISNGIATQVLPSDCWDADSIAVNINNNRKEQFFKNKVLLKEFSLGFSAGYANDEDWKICFE